MTLFLNGEATAVDDSSTVEELVDRLGLEPRTLLIEQNGRALLRGEWATAPVRENDRFEFLRISAGG
jgi:thiamine biosynthesis protein ThiS